MALVHLEAMKLLRSAVFTHLARYDRRAEADVMTVTLVIGLWKEQKLPAIRKKKRK